MQLFITILHIVLAFSMILIILLQPGKEGGAALAGGSSGNQMYGPRGAGNFLGKATTVVAAGFMLTSITLAYYSSEKVQSGSDLEDVIKDLEGFDEEDEAEDWRGISAGQFRTGMVFVHFQLHNQDV